MAETMVHRCQWNNGHRDGWTGDRWLAYRDDVALCDEAGNVLYFDLEAEAKAALKNPALKTVREYLRGRR